MTPFIIIGIIASVSLMSYLTFEVYSLKQENESQKEINEIVYRRLNTVQENIINHVTSSTELASKVTKNTDAQEEWNKRYVALENAFKHFLIEEFKKNEKFPIKKRDIVYVGDSKRFILDVEYIVNRNWEVEVKLRTVPIYVTRMSLNEMYNISIQWLKKDQVSKTKPKKAKK